MNGANSRNNKTSFLTDNTDEVTRRFTLGVREVVRDHALSGNPVAIWRDGRVVLLTPEAVLNESIPPPSAGDEPTTVTDHEK
jgi:hypothetical protein